MKQEIRTLLNCFQRTPGIFTLDTVQQVTATAVSVEIRLISAPNQLLVPVSVDFSVENINVSSKIVPGYYRLSPLSVKGLPDHIKCHVGQLELGIGVDAGKISVSSKEICFIATKAETFEVEVDDVKLSLDALELLSTKKIKLHNNRLENQVTVENAMITLNESIERWIKLNLGTLCQVKIESEQQNCALLSTRIQISDVIVQIHPDDKLMQSYITRGIIDRPVPIIALRVERSRMEIATEYTAFDLELNRTSLWTVEGSGEKRVLLTHQIRLNISNDDTIDVSVDNLNFEWSPEAFIGFGAAGSLIIHTQATVLKQMGMFVRHTSSREWTIQSCIQPMRSMEDILATRQYTVRVEVTKIKAQLPYDLDDSVLNEIVTAQSLIAHVESDSRWNLVIQNAIVGSESSYLTVNTFAVEESFIPNCPKSIVDLLARDVVAHWTPEYQLRVTKVVHDITYSVWQALFLIQKKYRDEMCEVQPNGGVNAALDDQCEYERYQRLLPHLLSASGDKLHRLDARNLDVTVEFDNSVILQVKAGVFGGVDLPDIWHFEQLDVEYKRIELVTVESIDVRHTLDRRSDYCYGEFEARLRERQKHVGRSSPIDNISTGFLITVQHPKILIPNGFSMDRMSKQIELDTAALIQALRQNIPQDWRPQDDLLYTIFLPTLCPTETNHFWIDVEDFKFEIGNDPFEAWLELMYPLWIDELNQQELRRHVLKQHRTALKTTNVDLLTKESKREMYALLQEKGAQMYINRVREYLYQNDETIRCFTQAKRIKTSTLCSAKVSLVQLTVTPLPSDTLYSILDGLDEMKLDRKPEFELLAGTETSLDMESIQVQICNFNKPLFVARQVQLSSRIVLAQTKTLEKYSVKLTGFRQQLLQVSFVPLKAFFEGKGSVHGLCFTYGPGFEHALEHLAVLSKRLEPKSVSLLEQEQPFWDLIRRRVHGTFDASIHDAKVQLLCTTTTYEADEYIELGITHVDVSYKVGHISVDANEVEVFIVPMDLKVAWVKHIHGEMKLGWDCDEENHYLYPLVFSDQIEKDRDDILAPYRSKQLSISLSASVNTIYISCYGNSIEWLYRWGRIYQNVPPLPYQKRRGLMEARKRNRLLNHLKSIRLEDIVLKDITCSVHLTKTITLSIGTARCIGEFTVEESNIEMFETRKVPLPMNSRRIWSLHDSMLSLEKLKATIQGTFILGLRQFGFSQDRSSDCPTNQYHTLQQHMYIDRRLTHFNYGQEIGTLETDTTLVDYFGIDPIYSCRYPSETTTLPGDVQGLKVDEVEEIKQQYLLEFQLCGLRILAGLEALHDVLDSVEEAIELVFTAIPSLSDPSDDVLEPREERVKASTSVSLADDPKFAALFNKSPIVRKPSTHAEPEKYFIVSAFDCQINIESSILLSITSSVVQGEWDPVHQTECIEIQLHAVQLFAAPKDVDVESNELWLKAAKKIELIRPPRLLKNIIRPTNVSCRIQVEHGTHPKVKVIHLTLDELNLCLSSHLGHLMFDILTTVIYSLTERLKLKEKEAQTQMLRHELTVETDSGGSVGEKWRELRQLKWKLHHDPTLSDEIHSKTQHILRLIQKEKQNRHSKPTIEIHSTLVSCTCTITAEHGGPLLELHLSNVIVHQTKYPDLSSTLHLKLDRFKCTNDAADIITRDVIDTSWLEHHPMLHLDAELAAPVAGLRVLKHFEINLHPLQINLTQDLILQLRDWMKPPSGTISKQEEEIRQYFLTKASGPSVTSAFRAAKQLALRLPTTPTLRASSQEVDKVHVDEEEDAVVIEMKARARNYMTFKHLRLGEVKCRVSYSGKQEFGLEDMRGFEIKVHPLIYSNKTCTLKEFMCRVRRDILLDLMSQVGRNFTNLGVFLKERLGAYALQDNSTSLLLEPTVEQQDPNDVFLLEMPSKKFNKFNYKS